MAKTAGNGHRQVQLACHHFVRIPVTDAVRFSSDFSDGTDHACPYDGLQLAIHAWSSEWHWACQDCPASRWLGQDEAGARDAAARHKAKYERHRVMVAYDRITKDGRGSAFTLTRQAYGGGSTMRRTRR